MMENKCPCGGKEQKLVAAYLCGNCGSLRCVIPEPKPKPKYKEDQKVFALIPSGFGFNDLTNKWLCVKKVESRRDHFSYFMSDGYYYRDEGLTLTPTWEQEFEATEAGRKKLALELIKRGVEKVEYLFMGGWSLSQNSLRVTLEDILRNSSWFHSSNYRFAPETDTE